MTNTESGLDFVVYRKSASGEHPNVPQVAALSRGLNTQDAELWRSLVALSPFPGKAGRKSEAVGIFNGPDQDFILARARHPEKHPDESLYQFVRLSRANLQSMIGHLHMLLESMVITTVFDEDDIHNHDPIDLPPSPTWTADRRHAILEKMHFVYKLEVPALIRLLGAALHPQRLLIRNFAEDSQARLDLVEAIATLLPVQARPSLTFSTHLEQLTTTKIRIAFHDGDQESERWVADFAEKTTLPDDSSMESIYLKMLENLWEGDLGAFISDLRVVDVIASYLMPDRPLIEGLNAVANRQQLDQAILDGDEIPLTQLMNVITGHYPPEGQLKRGYVMRLLNYALNEREAEAVKLLATIMSGDDVVAQMVLGELKNLQDSVPDDVYFFLRTSMSYDLDPELIPLLHSSANAALELALADGDNETLMNWLNLVAREPAEYELAEILRRGIVAAQRRAHEDGHLGNELLFFAARRAPAMIDTLIYDRELIEELGPPIGSVLRDYDPEQASVIFETGREISLIVLSLIAQDAPEDERAASFFTEDVTEFIWALYLSHTGSALPDHYQVESLLMKMIKGINKWLPKECIEILLINSIHEENVDLFSMICTQLDDKSYLIDELISVFQNNATPPATLMELVGGLKESQNLNNQDTLNIFLQVAANRDWGESTRPLVDRAARMIQQDQTLTVSLDSLWQMLRLASSESKMEAVASVVTRRALVYLEALQDETEQVEMLLRLHSRLEWSKSLRGYLMNWWRDFVRLQPVASLQQIDRILDGKKELIEERAVLQTTLAIRRMMGQRSLPEFAESINTAYNVLQAISESFDPTTRTSAHFDQAAVRAELAGQDGELTPDQRRVLAKNLKELAQLVVLMSDQRTKPAIMRREEDVERQLISGEQDPQSAIDTMRWLAGYLNGSQQNPDALED